MATKGNNDMKTIVKVIFGSHLYGTSTPESDKDYKGIFMPAKEQIFLGRIPKSYNETTKRGNEKNTSEDIDTEIYSLHYFIKLACEGQTVALDMLHAPDNMILETSDIWKKIVKNREKFYTKNLKAFIGYARRQASKYGIKGSRLNAAAKIIKLLGLHDETLKMKTIWDQLPIEEHLYMVEANRNAVRQYQVCGKIIQETAKIGYVLDILVKFYNEYGRRAREASENKNIDWKAISHALRAAYQVQELLQDGAITFPLKNAEFLRAVKQGEFDYKNIVAPTLELLVSDVETLSEKSKLPEKADRKFWDKFIIETIEECL
jgi:hypothetical protein